MHRLKNIGLMNTNAMTDRVEMILEYNGKQVSSAMVIRSFEHIEKQRYRWVHTYGLTVKKDWKIYLNVPSTMGYGEPMNFNFKKPFPFNQNHKHETESSETDTDRTCQPANN